MGTKPLEITLSWPDKALSPNGRVHWGRKHKATATARANAKLAARAKMRLANWKTCQAATIHTTFIATDKRRRDRDNHQAMCKAYFDGFADAGVIANDCGFTQAPAVFVKGSARCVQFLIHATE